MLDIYRVEELILKYFHENTGSHVRQDIIEAIQVPFGQVQIALNNLVKDGFIAYELVGYWSDKHQEPRTRRSYTALPGVASLFGSASLSAYI